VSANKASAACSGSCLNVYFSDTEASHSLMVMACFRLLHDADADDDDDDDDGVIA